MRETRYYVQDHRLIDDGYNWYHILSMDMELWRWLTEQPVSMWQGIKGAPEFDIREDLYNFLIIKFGK